MTVDDKKRFSVVMYWLGQRMTTPGGAREITPDLQRDYFEALSDVRIERIEWGAKHIFKTGKWFPMPSDIRDAAMLAPSTVLESLPAAEVKQVAEFTQEQIEESKRKIDELISGFGEWCRV